jgi:fluoride exporter
MNTALVMIGGALGAAARYQLGGWATRAFGSAFPWGTLLVNLMGGFLIGLLFARAGGEPARLLLGVGLLGGFTTFSAFSLETIQLLERGTNVSALAYVAASVTGALLATWAGLTLGRAI